jgi:hypothetical protein
MAKRPRDLNQLAKLVVDIATGEAEDTVSPKKRAISVRGRSGGLKGGIARASKISPLRRSEIAQKAAKSRWERP